MLARSDRLPFDDDRSPMADGRSTMDDEARSQSRRSRPQRRPGSVGRHGQDPRTRRSLPQPAEPWRRPRKHPGDYVHSESRGGNARSDSERAGRACRVSAGPRRHMWRDLRERAADVAISTIDAFCLSLLREFPLEADLDPGFDMADETQVPRLMEEALDRALDISRGLTRSDETMRLLFAELREHRLKDAFASHARPPSDHRRVAGPCRRNDSTGSHGRRCVRAGV